MKQLREELQIVAWKHKWEGESTGIEAEKPGAAVKPGTGGATGKGRKKSS